MKKINLIAILISYFSVSGQTIQYLNTDSSSTYNSKLDGRNGFKDFKFGDSINKYKNRLQIVDNRENELELIGDDPSSLFNLKWEKLYAMSEKERLKSIAVFWKDDKVTLKTLLKNLELIYGKSYVPKIKKLKTEGFEVHAWQGNNLKMILYRDSKSVSPKPCDDCNIVLVLYCMKFADTIENDF